MAIALFSAQGLFAADTAEENGDSTATSEERSEEEADTSDDIDLKDIPVIQEPAQNVEEVMERREEQESMAPDDDDYPAISGCDPLEGDREALPLLDRAHRAVSEALCNPAERVDSTLGTDEDEELPVDSDDPQQTPLTGTALLRLSLDFDFQPDRPPEPGYGLSASIRLPQAYNRLVRTGRRQAENMGWEDLLEDGSTEDVHWLLRPVLYTAALTDIGLRGFYPFIRLRVPIEQTYQNDIGWRVRPEVYWRLDDGAGVGSELRVSYPHDTEDGLVLNNRIETNEAITDADEGWRWSHSLTHRHRFKERSSLTSRAQIGGWTEPGYQAQDIRADLRLRRSAFRPWFYAEVEPYLEWQRENDFEQTPGIIFRVEVQLGDYPLRDDF